MRGDRALTPRILVGVAVVVALVLLTVRVLPAGGLAARAVDDLGQLLAAALACGACAWRACRPATARARASWLLLALGTGSWALGEAVWSWYELLQGRANPFPSVADAGFLLFPCLAACGLLLWPSAVLGAAARWRGLLDAVLVVAALFVVTWTTALGALVHGADTDGTFTVVVSLAYPVADVLLLTVTIVFATHRSRSAGSGLGLLTLGLICLAVSDSAFAYLTAIDRYATGSPVDAGWVGGFLLIAVAAWTAKGPTDGTGSGSSLESSTMALLPYAPAVVALAVATVTEVRGGDDRVPLAAGGVVVAALLVRQMLAVLDNRRLVRQLVDAEQELRHRAFHDPLTGLANRALFADRLRHGLDLHRRDLRPLSVLYCDLDGFKAVNDTFGHDGGDEVLRAAAERLRAVTRPGDTVARIGGDEFAVLLEDDCDAPVAAARILDAFSQPATVGRSSFTLGTSIGVAQLAAEDCSVDASVLMRRADTAMYQAKRAGKGRVVVWSAGASAPAASAPAHAD